jgi:hypothetical protein
MNEKKCALECIILNGCILGDEGFFSILKDMLIDN